MTGFASLVVGKALTSGGCDQFSGAHQVGIAARGEYVVPEIRFRQVAVQVGRAEVLIDAMHGALEQ